MFLLRSQSVKTSQSFYLTLSVSRGFLRNLSMSRSCPGDLLAPGFYRAMSSSSIVTI